MSYKSNPKSLQMTGAAAIRQEFEESVPRILAASGHTAKVIALFADRSPKTGDNYRTGTTNVPAPEFFALARQIPALREKALEWLGAANHANDQNPVEVAAFLMQALGSLPQSTVNAALKKIDEERKK